MYPRYNMVQNRPNMYQTRQFRGEDDRFFGGGIIAPLLLGGLAGYAIGRPNDYYPPYNNFYNNFYYQPYQPYPFYPYNNFYY